MNARLCWIALPAFYGVFLAWQEWDFRERFDAPVPFATPVSTPPSMTPLNTTAIVAVLGLTTETSRLPSAEPLTLQASFVLGAGLSRALLADAQGARVYQVGDQLPGGSVLRRVEADQAVLWNKGREEVLQMQTVATRFLQRFDALEQASDPAPSVRFLRPHIGQPE